MDRNDIDEKDENKAAPKVRRVVVTPTFIDGELKMPGQEVMVSPKTHPSHWPVGHEKAHEPHPKAGQIVNEGAVRDGFSANLAAPASAAAQAVSSAIPDRPEGIPANAVFIQGHWFTPAGVAAPDGDDGEGSGPMTLADMGKQSIQAALTAKGIAYDPKATRAALIELAEKHGVVLA